MTFGEFINAYNTGTILNNVGWRAYDIEASVRPEYVLEALKYLGYAYAKDLALPTVATVYGISSSDETRTLLGLWWAFERINDRRVRRGVPMRKPTL